MSSENLAKPIDVYAQLLAEFASMNANSHQAKILEYEKEGVPTVMGNDDFFPELFTAFDLPYYFLVRQGLEFGFHAGKGSDFVDGYNELGGSSSLCSLQKVAAYLLMKGKLPKPSAVITTTNTCDGQTAANELMFNYEPWADLPKMSFDASFVKDEAGMAYLGRQWMKVIPLLEKVSGKKLDLDRLREVCEESNKQSLLCFDFQELRRAKPSPVRADWGFFAYMMTRWTACGMPEGTAWVQKLFDATVEHVKNGLGIDGVNEKIRYAWLDILPCWKDRLFPRLEKDYGAVNIMSLPDPVPPWPVIDTSSLETIFTSFAKRFLTASLMVRQIFAESTVYGEDMVDVAKNFKCDAIIMPSHVGHKDIAASGRIIRDMLRQIGVPFLVVGCDVFDERYMPADVVYQKIATFFETSGLT